MQRIAMGIAFFLIALWCYLFLTNAYIYHRIQTGNLSFPDTKHAYSFAGPGATKIYAALGDSLTAGAGVEKYPAAFPYQLAQKLASHNAIELKVFAYPGLRSANLLTDYVPAAIAAKPDITTLLIGTNDIHGRVPAKEFETNYRAILAALSKTHAKIYAISIPYLGSRTLIFPPMNFYFDYKTRQFNTIIQKLAAEYKVTYIDIAEPTQEEFKSDSLYSADSFHPNSAGYTLWADSIYENIHR